MAKEGNLELLKIPNFLHLTPVAIKKHCEALKDFCIEWPAALDSDEKCEKHFPIEMDTADYVSSGPSIRNPKARVVTLRVRVIFLKIRIIITPYFIIVFCMCDYKTDTFRLSNSFLY